MWLCVRLLLRVDAAVGGLVSTRGCGDVDVSLCMWLSLRIGGFWLGVSWYRWKYVLVWEYGGAGKGRWTLTLGAYVNVGWCGCIWVLWISVGRCLGV